MAQRRHNTMTKFAFAVTIAANLILGFMWWNLRADFERLDAEYDRLLTWACENASLGGHECRED